MEHDLDKVSYMSTFDSSILYTIQSMMLDFPALMIKFFMELLLSLSSQFAEVEKLSKNFVLILQADTCTTEVVDFVN